MKQEILSGVPEEDVELQVGRPGVRNGSHTQDLDTILTTKILKRHPNTGTGGSTETNPLLSGDEQSLSPTTATTVFDHARQTGQHPRGEGGGTCCTQLGSTMLRVLTLMKREWVSVLIEFLIPIIFVGLTVVVWSIIGSDLSNESDSYTPGSVGRFQSDMDLLRSEACYDVTVGVIPGLKQCVFPTSRIGNDDDDDDDDGDGDGNNHNNNQHMELYCPVGHGIPPGFCYPDELMNTMTDAGQTYYADTTAIIPTFDEMVLMLWCGLDSDLEGREIHFGESSTWRGGKLYFAPNTPAVASLIDHLRETTTFFDVVYGGTYNSADEANKAIAHSKDNDDKARTWGVIVVDALSKDKFDITIRLNASSLPSTKDITQPFYIGGTDVVGNDQYFGSGFLTLQTAVYDYYIQKVLGISDSVPNILYTPMPTAAFEAMYFMSMAYKVMPLIIILGFMYPMSQMVKRIVLEKELRIREAMLIMGLSEFVMYAAWFLIYMVLFTVSSAAMAGVLYATYLNKSSFGYPFFLFLFFTYSLIALAGLIASLFSKARLAAMLAPLIFFITAIPLFATANLNGSGRTGFSVFSPTALSIGIQTLIMHDATGGAHKEELTYPFDEPTFLVIFIMLVADTAIYLLLMTYFDMVLPKEWGTRKHPLFFIIDPIKWCIRCSREPAEDDSCEDGRAADGVFEPIANEESASVRILALRKKFKRGGKSFVAVNNFCWSLKEGEISVLLGHNGAGKSTTMNLMTGMLAPDGGDCIIYGRSIRHDLQGARQEIGLCPQHNILWPTLTVREHLDYYAAIKGLKGEAREASIKRLLAAVDLAEKEHDLSSTLSGGQKRKLSVAIAFVGGSRLVFLDEPTAGMDVGARRHTWGLLKEMSRHHTILLSTHFMDEADLLGSQVGIMSHGRMQCSGSNMFLKSQLGVGFMLTMSVAAGADRVNIDGVVRKHIADVEPLGTGAGEASYRLPMHAKAQFASLFDYLEKEGAALGVAAYSISATTLEEIFLKIANGGCEQDEEAARDELGGAEGEDGSNKASHAVWDTALAEEGMPRHWLQFRAMMIKRFWNSLRDRRTQFFQIICPVLCVLLAMLFSLIQFWAAPPLTLSSDMYKRTLDVPLSQCEDRLSYKAPRTDVTHWTFGPKDGNANGFQDRLLDTYGKHKYQRFSGIMCNADTLDSVTYDSIFYNVSAPNEVPVATLNYYASRIRHLANVDVNLRTVNAPLPLTKHQTFTMDIVQSFVIAMVVMIPFTFIPSTFVAWIVKERECKARHLQNVSGLNFYIYWLTNFLFDFSCYLISMFLVVIVFLIFNRKEYVGGAAIGPLIVSLLLYGLSGIAMSYAVNFIFSSHSTAQNVVMFANFVIGFLLVLGVAVVLQVGEDNAKDVVKGLRWVFRLFPSYCMGECICLLGTANQLHSLFDQDVSNLWAMHNTGWACLYMGVEIPLFLLITLFVDHPGRRQRTQRLLHRANAQTQEDAYPERAGASVREAAPPSGGALGNNNEEDVDVTAEREAVLHDSRRSGDLVRVQHMRKVYGNGKVAVRDVTFGVKPGEVFGFLGTNGAGKTTAISILCQEFYPTAGRASICGYDIVENSQEALSCIGYCPQFDACLDLLTVEEHLYLYAGVRGIPTSASADVVESLMKLCELTPYHNTRANELSGGNRRKLSVAVSLIGGPRVVFLDEPSAGMDPVARRGLWNAIQAVSSNCSIVLTTHHLEEVEALAHRVAIMVDGTLHCIGDKTHLKSKFGAGYEVTLRVGSDDAAAATGVKNFFCTAFPSSNLVEERIGRLTYEVPSTVKLSEVFDRLEESQQRLGVADYGVSQTSLEQVFMRISAEAEQRQEQDAAQLCCGMECRCC